MTFTRKKVSAQRKQQNENDLKNVLKHFKNAGNAIVQIIELLEMEVDNLKKITFDNNKNNL